MLGRQNWDFRESAHLNYIVFPSKQVFFLTLNVRWAIQGCGDVTSYIQVAALPDGPSIRDSLATQQQLSVGLPVENVTNHIVQLIDFPGLWYISYAEIGYIVIEARKPHRRT